MRRPGRTTRTATLAAGLVATLLATACDGDDASSGSASTPSGPKGELTVVSQGPVLAWDPQRIGSRHVAGFAGRTWMRTLTSYVSAPDVSGQRRVVGDLAVNTGKPSKDLTSWTFTLRDGLTWQDGSKITCAEVRYGVSRSFDDKTGSSGYALTYLDIPKKPDGTSTYPGPYGKAGRSAKAKKLIEDAVECSGRKVTFNLGEPVANFDEIVSLPEFAPFKKSEDKREKSAHAAFSSGPYKLKDGWTPSKGGTWVRNEEWSAGNDPVRSAGPERIVHTEGVEPGDALSSIGEDSGSRTLMLDPLPPALRPQLDELGDQAQSVGVDGQIVDYIAPNLESTVFKRKNVRAAFAAATDREGYVNALGGESGGVPTWSLLPTILPSTHDTVDDHGPSGDAEAAKDLLEKAKVKAPVKVRLAYRSNGEAMDAAMKKLVEGWKAGGFEVTLEPIDGRYFETVADRSTVTKLDAVWANWGPDYPSASTVLPPLFDDRINLTKTSVGRDYGLVADSKLNSRMDKTARIRGDADRAEAWAEIDADLLEDGAYIPLRQSRLTYAAGHEITSFVGNAAYGGVPDLGRVGVSR